MSYEKFNPKEIAELALNYLVSMVDKKNECLPYWLIGAHENPAVARHCRVDDAELVASWYEGLDAVRKVIDREDGQEVLDGFYSHLVNRSWGEHGLRYNANYSWSNTNHSSFHEMGYVLASLVRILKNNPDDKTALVRASKLVEGLRSLVIERKKQVFWAGDYPEESAIYEFPNDIYLKDGGFDLSCHTGRGEQAIRASVLVHPLICLWDITGDETALDLARGISNYMLGPSRYFNYKMEFFGHIHSAVWFAAGLVRMGNRLKDEKYISKGKGIYDYVRSLSSSFGWVPEYAQWRPTDEEFCETCCIKSMILCGFELIDCGYGEYWNDVNLFARNQLAENQIKDGSFVSVDNSKPDSDDATYQNVDKRIVGGFSGGSEPNSISLKRFRSIAGCCVGTAPQAVQDVWEKGIRFENGTVYIDVPMDKELPQAAVSTKLPNEGNITVKTHQPCSVAIRLYSWMPDDYVVSINSVAVTGEKSDGYIVLNNLPAGANIIFSYDLKTEVKDEKIRGKNYQIHWRGCDVVKITPEGDHLRLYQRDMSVPKVYPKPLEIEATGLTYVIAPTQQK